MAQQQAAGGATAPSLHQPFSIRGLVHAVRSRESAGRTVFRTLIKVPSTDPYKGPGTFEVESLRRLGAKGSEVDQVVELVGYADSWRDKESGETILTARHVLRAVEGA